MTPEEKAKELVEKFISPTKVYHEHLGWVNYLDSAKECALIAVNEILKDREEIDGMRVINDPYWSKVKQEIEKL
jgi:hypothetical protein